MDFRQMIFSLNIHIRIICKYTHWEDRLVLFFRWSKFLGRRQVIMPFLDNPRDVAIVPARTEKRLLI